MPFRERVWKIKESEPELMNSSDWYGWTREEKYADIYKKLGKFKEIQEKVGLGKINHKERDDIMFTN